MILVIYYSQPCVVPSNLLPRIAYVTNKMWQKCCIINGYDCHLGLILSWVSSSGASWLSCCEEVQAAYGDNHLVRNGGLVPAAMCVNLKIVLL